MTFIDKNHTVFDYFADFGTRGHAVINLNREENGKRKYLLVEMGEYFDSVTKPRIQQFKLIEQEFKRLIFNE